MMIRATLGPVTRYNRNISIPTLICEEGARELEILASFLDKPAYVITMVLCPPALKKPPRLVISTIQGSIWLDWMAAGGMVNPGDAYHVLLPSGYEGVILPPFFHRDHDRSEGWVIGSTVTNDLSDDGVSVRSGSASGYLYSMLHGPEHPEGYYDEQYMRDPLDFLTKGWSPVKLSTIPLIAGCGDVARALWKVRNLMRIQAPPSKARRVTIYRE